MSREARPLVVLDPEDREQMRALMHALWDADDDFLGMRTTGRWNEILSTALRSLLDPPKPDEPTGLGAVVEDATGARWTRWTTDPLDEGCWLADAASSSDTTYSDIAAVRVLSPGVTA